MGRIVGGATGINSGLIRNNAVCKSYQRFATAGTSTWHKPANANWVYLEIIGGGGSGGGGGSAPQVDADYAGGGGGAAVAEPPRPPTRDVNKPAPIITFFKVNGILFWLSFVF